MEKLTKIYVKFGEGRPNIIPVDLTRLRTNPDSLLVPDVKEPYELIKEILNSIKPFIDPNKPIHQIFYILLRDTEDLLQILYAAVMRTVVQLCHIHQ